MRGLPMVLPVNRPHRPTYAPPPRGGSGAPPAAAAVEASPIAQAFPGLEAGAIDLAKKAFGWLKGLFTTATAAISRLLEAAPAVSPAAPALGSYTVQAGDSLYAIAQRTLGNGDRWPEIYAANRHQIANANVIFAGQVLTLPGGAPAAPTPSPAPASPSGDFGSRAAAAGRQLQAAGYRYTVNLSNNYHPVRFQVGCCADFAVDAWARAGIDVYAKASNPHSCTSLMNYFKSGNDGHQWRANTASAAPGDMIFFDWDRSGDPDHVAIVTEVDGNGRPTRIVESYDFNLPARERDVTGSLGFVIGYGRA